MRNISIRLRLGCLAIFGVCVVAGAASAQTRTIRIVSYNIEADIGGFTTPRPGLITPSSGGSVTNGGALEGIGEEILGSDPAQPIDILGLEETTSNLGTVQPIVDGLNAFYSSRGIPAGYALSTLTLTTTGGTGGGPSAMVYNTNTVQLIASVRVGTPSGSGIARQIGRYLFAPAGVATNASNIFYVYVSHAKSGTDSASINRRTVEANVLRADSATLPSDARILYTGDFNCSSSSEGMYGAMIAAGVNRAYDLLNLSGSATNDWGSSTSNTGILAALTESDTNLRFRDDYQMMTSNVIFGVTNGLAYVPGTYHTFANNGTIPYNGTVNSVGNTALNSDLNTNAGLTKSAIYQDLSTGSDHLPQVADYTIPISVAAPVASFNGSPTSGVAPLAVTFADTSTGSITNWSWNFGDGGTTNLTINSVLYTYNTAGVYTVTEIVSGAGGSSTNTQVNYITVLTPFQAWQTQYFGSTTNPAAAANADPDGDGQNNLAEFLAATNPTNSASGLQITSVTTQGSDVLVTWTTAGGETNVVQATAGLPDGSYSTNFQDLSGLIIISGSGDATTNYLDSGGATNVPSRYYRIRLQP